jgi:lipopolysaccharide export system protein LptA
MPRTLKILALLLTLCSLTAQAATAVQTRNDKLRPKGPVTVTADRAEFDKAGVMIYNGNVLLVADNLQLKGDRLELRQFPGDQYEAKLKGSLAHMEQSGDVDEKGQPLPPMLADGQDMLYDTRTGLLDIIGQAKAVRGKNEVNGNTIRYNVNERRVQANGGQGGQVKIIIQSPPPANKSKAPRAAGRAATPSTPPLAAPIAPVTPINPVPAPTTAAAPASAVTAPQPSESASTPVTPKP